MNQAVIDKASAIINGKTGYIGGGMEGYAALALIDEQGYPTASTLTIAKADGIKWLTFCTSPGQGKVSRIEQCNRASVCINSSEYNITLVGTIEILTDLKAKQDNWLPIMDDGAHWSGPDDPAFCVLRFTMERYSIYVADADEEAVGTLQDASDHLQKPQEHQAPSFEPIFVYNNGQCAQAIALYEKALGATVMVLSRYGEENPENTGPVGEAEKNLIFHAQIKIGKQTILLADDKDNSTKIGSQMQMVVEFDTEDGLKSAYEALADGATDLLPPHRTPYSPCVAGLTDKFGIPWQLMVWHGY